MLKFCRKSVISSVIVFKWIFVTSSLIFRKLTVHLSKLFFSKWMGWIAAIRQSLESPQIEDFLMESVCPVSLFSPEPSWFVFWISEIFYLLFFLNVFSRNSLVKLLTSSASPGTWSSENPRGSRHVTFCTLHMKFFHLFSLIGFFSCVISGSCFFFLEVVGFFLALFLEVFSWKLLVGLRLFRAHLNSCKMESVREYHVSYFSGKLFICILKFENALHPSFLETFSQNTCSLKGRPVVFSKKAPDMRIFEAGGLSCFVLLFTAHETVWLGFCSLENHKLRQFPKWFFWSQLVVLLLSYAQSTICFPKYWWSMRDGLFD